MIGTVLILMNFFSKYLTQYTNTTFIVKLVHNNICAIDRQNAKRGPLYLVMKSYY